MNLTIPVLSTAQINGLVESALLDMQEGNALLKTRGVEPTVHWSTIRDKVDNSLADSDEVLHDRQ